MKPVFESAGAAIQYAEVESRKQNKELFVIKQIIGGIRYCIVDKVAQGDKVLIGYKNGLVK
jgi:hypothetical protein